MEKLIEVTSVHGKTFKVDTSNKACLTISLGRFRCGVPVKHHSFGNCTITGVGPKSKIS